MKYQVGQIGRSLVVKFEHGDDILTEMRKLAQDEKIERAVFFMIGALKKAYTVVGPEECTIPPTPVGHKIEDGHEIVAIGTLFPDEQGLADLHVHTALGRGKASVAGCLRGETEVYLIVEAIVIELTGIGAVRGLDPFLQLKALLV